MNISFIFLAQSLSCYAPKLEYVKNVPIFRQNNFEIVKCNIGLQKCMGGCTHCMTVDGPFIAKSCAGDHDISLKMLGIHADGCKNITEKENNQYAKWIMNSIGRQMKHLPNFTGVCRCSWNGCNGIPSIELMKMPHFIFQKQVSSTAGRTAQRNTLIMIYIVFFIIFYGSSYT